MLGTRESDAIEQAFSHAWIVEDQIPVEERGARMHSFREWWGGFEMEAFERALHEGNEEDRLVALFALGYLAFDETHDLLFPFLSSSIQKERWASAIVLGTHQDERAFALLGALLLDHLEPYSPPTDEQKISQSVFQARNQTREQYGSSAVWERFVHPGLVQAWNEAEQYRHDYLWYMSHRLTIINILAAWNDPQAILMLRQALQRCWETETRTRRGSLQLLHQLQDKLAYSFGLLEAWNALEGLETAGLPPSRFKLARMFLILGALRVNLQNLYDGNLKRLITLGTVNPEQVTAILRERFGLDEYLARANLKAFQQWYQERDELGKWQRRLERGDIEGLSWPPEIEWTHPQEGEKREESKPTFPGELPSSKGPGIRKLS